MELPDTVNTPTAKVLQFNTKQGGMVGIQTIDSSVFGNERHKVQVHDTCRHKKDATFNYISKLK